MERGPVALFGAIVAVGLGPALWIGVQMGKFEVEPGRPPASVRDDNSGSAQLDGGTGAGETTPDGLTTIDTTPQAHILPLTASPSYSTTHAYTTKPSTEPTTTPASTPPASSPSPSAHSSAPAGPPVSPSESPSSSPDPGGSPSDPTSPTGGGTDPSADASYPG